MVLHVVARVFALAAHADLHEWSSMAILSPFSDFQKAGSFVGVASLFHSLRFAVLEAHGVAMPALERGSRVRGRSIASLCWVVVARRRVVVSR